MSKDSLVSSLELLRTALHIYRVNVSRVGALFVVPFIFASLMFISTSGSSRTMFPSVGFSLALGLSSLLAGLGLITTLATNTIGERLLPTLTRSYSHILPLALTLLLTLFIFLGSFSLLIFPGLIITVLLSQTVFVFVADEKHGMEALLYSWQLVRDHFWGVCARLLFLWAITIMVMGALTILLSLFGLSSFPTLGLQELGALARAEVSVHTLFASIIFSAVKLLVVTPLSIVFLFELYHSLKSHAATTPQLTPESLQKRRTMLVTLGVIGICSALVFIIFSRVLFNYTFSVLELFPGPSRDFVHILTEIRSLTPQPVQVHFTR